MILNRNVARTWRNAFLLIGTGGGMFWFGISLLAGRHTPQKKVASAVSPIRNNRVVTLASTEIEAQENADDRAIFTALLSQTGGSNRPYVVEQETMLWDSFRWQFDPSVAHYSKSNHVPLELIQNMRERDHFAARAPVLTATPPLQYVPGAELTRVFKHGFWKEFYEKYPGTAGMIQFSLPGYSQDKQTALVCFSHYSGGKSGMTAIYLLNKKAGRWTITRLVSGDVS